MSVRDYLRETLEAPSPYADKWVWELVRDACDELDELHKRLKELTPEPPQ